MTRLAIPLALVLAISILAPSLAAAPVNQPDQSGLVKGNNEFAFGLYARLRQQPGNLFFSPFSVSTALAMTYAGARGRTAQQMAKVLDFGVDSSRLHPAFGGLLRDLNTTSSQPGFQLALANALWGQKEERWLEPFLHITRANYGAGLRQVDFVSAPESARQAINHWVEEQTEGKIGDLIPSGILDLETRLVLTNAVYLKGEWASKFNREKTKDAPFTLTDGRQIQVPMMDQKAPLHYLSQPDFQAIEFPYLGRRFAMVILLPHKVDGLANLEKSLTEANFRRWLGEYQDEEVYVFLPRFRFASAFRLDDPLKAMGMPDAFTFGSADFSGMNGRRELFISAVLHKAYVDVNEEGTEAAAATGVVQSIGISPVFRADHPFLFVIRDRRTNSILFLGRVLNPSKN